MLQRASQNDGGDKEKEERAGEAKEEIEDVKPRCEGSLK